LFIFYVTLQYYLRHELLIRILCLILYHKSCANVCSITLIFLNLYRTTIEHLLDHYRTIIESLLNHYRTSIGPLSNHFQPLLSIYRITIGPLSNINRTSIESSNHY